MREQELRVVQLDSANQKPFVDDKPAAPAAIPALTAGVGEDTEPEAEADLAAGSAVVGDDLTRMLAGLERKLERLELDFQQGRVNAASTAPFAATTWSSAKSPSACARPIPRAIAGRWSWKRARLPS